jgi:hypothetical protein
MPMPPPSTRPIKLVFDTDFINTPMAEDTKGLDLPKPPQATTFQDINNFFAWVFQVQARNPITPIGDRDEIEIVRGNSYWCFDTENPYDPENTPIYTIIDEKTIKLETITDENAIVLVGNGPQRTAYFVENQQFVKANKGDTCLTKLFYLSIEEQALFQPQQVLTCVPNNDSTKKILGRIKQQLPYYPKLTTQKFKYYLAQSNYTSNEVMQDAILKLMLQTRIGLEFRIGAWVSLVLMKYSNIPSTVVSTNDRKAILEKVRGTPNLRLTTTISFTWRVIEQTSPLGEAVMKVLIKPDGTFYVEEFSATLRPNQENNQVCENTYNAYRTEFPASLTQKGIKEKTQTGIRSLATWPALSFFVFLFILLSFTGVFSPIAALTAAGGFNLGLGTFALALVDAAMGILTWAGIVTLATGALKGFEKIEQLFPEELHVRHVPTVASTTTVSIPTVASTSTVTAIPVSPPPIPVNPTGNTAQPNHQLPNLINSQGSSTEESSDGDYSDEPKTKLLQAEETSGSGEPSPTTPLRKPKFNSGDPSDTSPSPRLGKDSATPPTTSTDSDEEHKNPRSSSGSDEAAAPPSGSPTPPTTSSSDDSDEDEGNTVTPITTVETKSESPNQNTSFTKVFPDPTVVAEKTITPQLIPLAEKGVAPSLANPMQ